MSFWGNKLAGQKPSAIDHQPTPQRPGEIPAHLLPQGLTPAHQRAAAMQAFETAQTAPGDAPPEGSSVFEYGNTQGDRRGAAGNDNLGPCPDCGSHRYMQRANGWSVSTQMGALKPKPKCFDCGYPDQQGALAMAAKAEGPAQAARQGAMPKADFTPAMKVM